MKITAIDKTVDYYFAELGEFVAPDRDIFCNIPMKPLEDWCESVFGEQDIWGSEPVSGWKRMRNTFYFTREELRDMFVLRWT